MIVERYMEQLNSQRFFDDNDRTAITTLRMLAIDQVERANSGHPGLPLGIAPAVYVLFSRFLSYDSGDPNWLNRDRFVLSAGHGSALLYAALHLFGYPLSLDELKHFRQWGSLTPGHPEYGHTPGVEVTTGPLGQGLATSVGLALAERMLAARLNPLAGSDLINHRTFVVASDGDLMEGISHEAASLAGHLGLGRLVVMFDDNQITIDGGTELSCSDDVMMRFRAYGWHTLRVEDGEDLEAIATALNSAIEDDERPTLIAIRTQIGKGAPTKAGKSEVHGAPLGPEETRLTKAFFGWPTNEEFYVPDRMKSHFDTLVDPGRRAREVWQDHLDGLLQSDSTFARAWFSHFGANPDAPGEEVSFETGSKMATRVASKNVLNAIASANPSFVGGSADLAESTGTKMSGRVISRNDYSGNEIHFGIREHAMAACCNGIRLHGGFFPFCSTFLVFSDYLRPALRLSALMGLGVTYIFTHDSIALGEDGPTHQPIEHLAALRAIPGVSVLRPADANEVKEAWGTALGNQKGPSALILTRQALKVMPSTPGGWMARNGARIVRDDAHLEIVFVASGSEVSLALSAAEVLSTEHQIASRVVSMPFRERFFSLGREEQSEIIGDGLPLLIVEAGVDSGWDKLLNSRFGEVVSLGRFGASAPGDVVLRELGFSTANVVKVALDLITRLKGSKPAASLSQTSVELSDLAKVLLSATEAAAVSAQEWVGKGNKVAADRAAVEAMRSVLKNLRGQGVVVIGEGEKDKAPMLHVGEELGLFAEPSFDIGVDPLEGTNFCAKGAEGAISVVAVSQRGSMWTTPGFYMEKLVVPGNAASYVDILAPVEENLRGLSKALEKSISHLRVVVLSRPRNMELIERVRAMGAGVIEIADGDVMASLKVMLDDSTVDALMGIGGAPEGVITGAIAKELGASMQGRLAPQSEDERNMLDSLSPQWSKEVMTERDLVRSSSTIAISAVTPAYPMDGPLEEGSKWKVSSIVIENQRLIRVTRSVSPQGL